MDRNSLYYRQVRMLISLLPLIAEEDCFALKGGTAINLFVRDLPRLSVDIDLVYLPMDRYAEALVNVTEALGRIGTAIRNTFVNAQVTEAYRDKQDALRLVVARDGVQVKIELSPVLRGTVYPAEMRAISAPVEDEFGFAEMAVVSFADLYAGKICAALDRQHPRDLFDVHGLLVNEGVTSEVRKALMVYLISHQRPIAELLDPVFADLADIYAAEFDRMTQADVSLEDLMATREQLIEVVRDGLAPEEREFLLSFKAARPRWELLGVTSAQDLPAVQWKLNNLMKMPEVRRQAAYEKLEAVLRDGKQR